jgi:RNA polymerase sigma-70 factor (ECF subfamily)
MIPANGSQQGTGRVLRESKGVTDAELVARSLDGDPAAFGGLFERHASDVLRYLIRRAGPGAGEEMLSETFRIAFERRASFDASHGLARSWLYGIAANVLAKHLRTTSRRVRATERLAGAAARSEDPYESVEDALDAQRLSVSVTAALDDLPESDREIVLLYAWEELSYAEIAAALKVSVGTVKSRLSRARGRLREWLAKEGTSVDH